MNRNVIMVIFVLLIGLLAMQPVVAQFSGPAYYEWYSMYAGWQSNHLVWFISVATNDFKYSSNARWPESWSVTNIYPPKFTPRLTAALTVAPDGLSAARPVYVTLNQNQAPVFSTVPGQDDYSGLWQVCIVQFRRGSERGITNAQPASSTNKNGLPSSEEADIIWTNTVLDMPILAVGSLGGVWKSSLTDYRIPQAVSYDMTANPKLIELPLYSFVSQDPATSRRVTSDVLITDAEDPAIAAELGANLAPGLARMPKGSAQHIWTFIGPNPPGQMPLIDEFPCWAYPNTNPFYTPIAEVVSLTRNIPQNTVVGTNVLLKLLLNNGRLKPAGDSSILNAPVAYAY